MRQFQDIPYKHANVQRKSQISQNVSFNFLEPLRYLPADSVEVR